MFESVRSKTTRKYNTEIKKQIYLFGIVAKTTWNNPLESLSNLPVLIAEFKMASEGAEKPLFSCNI